MKKPDILLAIKPVARAFDQLAIPYYIGGSIASSAYGIARATMDVDIVADMTPDQVPALVGLLQERYYISEQAVDDAIADASCFNLVHLETMMKVDVFLPKKDPYHKSAMARRLADRLVEDEEESVVSLASAEDVILSKLRWYDQGGRISERQWRDVLGVFKVQSDSLDREYLIAWSNTLGLCNLLKQALSESGVTL
jgi:hypothetical protein